MASKKLSAKPTMREAFKAAQGPAVARPNGRGNGQGPAVNRKDKEDSDDNMSPPTGTTSTVPEKVKKANKKSYPKIKKK
jgi:hypothetical protein